MADNCVQDTPHNIFQNTADNEWSECTQYPPGKKYVPLEPRGGGDTGISSGPGGGAGGKSHGQRPYIGAKCYDEMMDRMPYVEYIKALKAKKSVFDKPYGDDDYEEMEHFAPVPPWPGPHRPNLPPVPEDWIKPRPPPPVLVGFCGITCWDDFGRESEGCEKVTGWCYPGPITLGSLRMWRVGGTKGEIPKKILSGKQIKYHLEMGGIEIYPNWDSVETIDNEKCVTYDVTLTEDIGRPEKNICTAEVTLCCVDQCDCPADPAIAYSADNPETIAQEGTATITVSGGCGPYTWSVTGTGFSFPISQTETGVNLLAADDTACGPAKLRISDYCGTEVIGYVRCTAGEWSLLCGSGPHGYCWRGGFYTEYPATFEGVSVLNLLKYDLRPQCRWSPYECVYGSCTDATNRTFTAYVPTEWDGICKGSPQDTPYVCSLNNTWCEIGVFEINVYEWACV